jgi:hypothetical protein
MSRPSHIGLMVAALSLTLPHSQIAEARDPLQSPANSQSSNSAAGVQDAASQMVPAEAALVRSLDAKKAKAGQEFQTTLHGKVQLKNGTELPSGTKLVGTISTVNTQPGSVKLALRFTKAELKSGKVIAIKAMIVGVDSPQGIPPDDITTTVSHHWDYNVQQIDESGVMGGVDLHSRISDEDSGVFVSTKKDDIKFEPRSQLVLAITAQENGA